MSKVLERKYFKKNAVKHFRAGGIVTLQTGGDVTKPGFFEKFILGSKTGGLDVGQQQEALKESVLGPKAKEIIAEKQTAMDPESALIGLDQQPKSITEDVVAYDEFPVKKEDPNLMAKTDTEKKPKSVVASDTQTDKDALIVKATGESLPTTSSEEDAYLDAIYNIKDRLKEKMAAGSKFNYPLMKMAMNLLAGTSSQRGLPAFAEIFGKAGSAAVGDFIAFEKEKTDRDDAALNAAFKVKQAIVDRDLKEKEIEAKKTGSGLGLDFMKQFNTLNADKADLNVSLKIAQDMAAIVQSPQSNIDTKGAIKNTLIKALGPFVPGLDKLTPELQFENLGKVLETKLTKAILNESRFSNQERQMVKEIIGQIKVGSTEKINLDRLQNLINMLQAKRNVYDSQTEMFGNALGVATSVPGFMDGAFSQSEIIAEIEKRKKAKTKKDEK